MYLDRILGSASITSEVADRVYYEFLIARYMPEILAIEKGSITPLKSEAFKHQLMQRVRSRNQSNFNYQTLTDFKK